MDEVEGAGETAQQPQRAAFAERDVRAHRIGSARRCNPRHATRRELMLEVPRRAGESETTHIRALSFENPAANGGITVLAVPGFAETAAVFERLAAALFADKEQCTRVSRLIAIDLLGRGGSEALTDTFSSLSLENDIDTLHGALTALTAQGHAPKMLLSHDVGATAITGLQELLLSGGSRLSALGIDDVALLAPIPPGVNPLWRKLDSENIEFDWESPGYVALRAEAWVAQSFTTRTGVLVRAAPTAEASRSRDYLTRIPLTSLYQLFGATLTGRPAVSVTFAPPKVRAGAFAEAHGTRLHMASFREDVLVSEEELTALYRHLTGDDSHAGLRVVAGPDAVHGMFITSPSRMLDAFDPW